MRAELKEKKLIGTVTIKQYYSLITLHLKY